MNDIIKDIQTRLAKANLYDGVIDGIPGPLTIKGVKEAIKLNLCTEADLYECENPKITNNFRYSELIHSNTAVRLGLSNEPSKEHKVNLIESCINLWQPTREILGKSMNINSGYRSFEVNNAVGGSKTSAHSIGRAIDFTSPGFGNTRQIAAKLIKEFKTKGIKFDQIILEFPDSESSWIHLGYKNDKGQQRSQVLTAVKRNGKTVYLSGLH